uniref:Tetratricopeptide repeat protein n=1 Tax=candidate division WOR-3 bacterium TaxID=2052148 RepID=A0A7V3RGV8_UNCW3
MMGKKMILLIFSICFLKAQEIDSTRIYLQIANTALSKGDYQVAIENYKSVLRFRPEHAAVAYNIPCCYSLLNNKPEALEWLKKAIDLGKYAFDEDEDLNNIRETKRYKKFLNKANKLLNRMKQIKPEPVILLPSDYDTNMSYSLLIYMHGWGSNPIDFSKNFQKMP